MPDPYVLPGTTVLKNRFNLTTQADLDDAEADFAALRLRELAQAPVAGDYGVAHFLSFHRYIFQDIYDWAGEPRRMNITKEEPVLGGLSIEYADYRDIRRQLRAALGAMKRRPWRAFAPCELAKWFARDLAALWKIHPFREGNTRTTIHFCCQFADDHGFPIDRGLFEENSHYVRTALVAYNAVFSDIGDKSQKQYLEAFIRDGIERI